MSFIEDHEDKILIELSEEEADINTILEHLDNNCLDKFNKYLKDNFIELICDIMFQYKRKGEISGKQKMVCC